MNQRSLCLAASLTALVTLMAAPASAESGRWNFHFSGIGPLPSGGDVGVDWQLARPVALELRVGGGALTDFGQLTQGIFFTSVGARFRFFDDESGYLDEGGSVAGNLWVAPHAGFFVTETAPGLLLDVSVGYDFSIVNPVSIAPFVRGGVGIGDVDIVPFIVGGVQLSIEVDPLREPVVDSDGDGVMDPRDACPSTARGMNVDGAGCPDTDRDTVFDNRDQCPDTPLGSDVDARGCIVLPPELVLDGIVFEYNSAAILPSSESSLARAAQLLRDNPDVRVEIGGHTDDIGSAQFNRELSLARATAVRDHLVRSGVVARRLEVRGYGATQPRAANDDEAGRSLNRRIEFRQLGERR